MWKKLCSSLGGRYRIVSSVSLSLSNLKLFHQYVYYSKSSFPLDDHYVSKQSDKTIFSLSSGAGKCAIAVVRVSGPNTELAVQLLTNRLPLPRRASVTKIFDPYTRNPIDRGILLWFPKPKSFTGEDSAEFHIHGGPAVIQALLSSLAKVPGLRPAEAGEFTKRAFLNGKLDLTEVEGLSDLLHAETEVQHQQALLQMEGQLSQLYQDWKSVLLKCAANVEAYIDFSEDDNIEDYVLQEAEEKIKQVIFEIKEHLKDSRRGELLRNGIQVTLLGETNVGKSSLLNCICRRPAAIVSPVAGTTRDVIDSFHNIGGYPVLFCDTAGMRETTDAIEVEGVQRAIERCLQANVIVLMMDASKHCQILLQQPQIPFKDYIQEYLQVMLDFSKCTASRLMSIDSNVSPENTEHRIDINNVVVVFNKSDLVDKCVLSRWHNNHLPHTEPTHCFLSCLNKDGLQQFLNILLQKVKERYGDPETGNVSFTKERHRSHLMKSLTHLETSLLWLNRDDVLMAEYLRKSVRQFGKILGEISSEDILDVIFKDFCIGK
ncbi:tRNA modification GTPase GTPBP3, mitochondrial [Octopus bimaculoides]|nr:tRNA modification GTPase GTPBP3, mitochondrial [Octopus bimaculoides]|eukprot:XP_014790354.1 PREDICTED: tRNA modification GTPase GTPBP3, mitochondrial-like [Octopus bimaculoides]